MKQSKVFFNDEVNKKLQILGVEKGIDKIKTASFVIEDYFTLISKIKASIKENDACVDTYVKGKVLEALEGLL